MADIRWGGLKDHWSDCRDEHDDGIEECSIGCDEGRIRWGSYYTEDNGICDDCGEETGISAMYAPGCIEYVCLPCYINHHARDCGCELWPEMVPGRREG